MYCFLRPWKNKQTSKQINKQINKQTNKTVLRVDKPSKYNWLVRTLFNFFSHTGVAKSLPPPHTHKLKQKTKTKQKQKQTNKQKTDIFWTKVVEEISLVIFKKKIQANFLRLWPKMADFTWF